ncbi:hypothetical protein AX14_014391 [Amanita brunnescens Koide BX004]|nr:hypothetical protein AX14_014391 [Amanita brunnescens Koide BX004]
MSSSQEHQSPWKLRAKSFLRNTFQPNSRKPASTVHDSPPNINSSRPISISPGNVPSDTDLVLRTCAASTARSALDPTGPDSQSLMIRAMGTATSRSLPQTVNHVELERVTVSHTPISPAAGSLAESDRINEHDVTTVSFTPAEPTPSLSTANLGHDHGQGSMTKRPLLLAWHGVEQLLKKIEPCLSGTPAKLPVNVLNTIIDIGKACLHIAESRCED